ncbi:MAG: copper chaperone PCu(A)C, partial [Ramlibacter sp.]
CSIRHMKMVTRSSIALVALTLPATAVLAHVSLQEPRAETGSTYRAVLRVGHGCDGSATRALTVQVPAGFAAVKPAPKPGWDLAVKGPVVTWTASGKPAMLPDGMRGEFVLGGTVPAAAGPLWFKVLQVCEQGSIDWSQVPSQGLSTAGMKSPAALLEVMAPRDLAQARLLPKVEGAWVRSAVPGQQGTGAFMKLTAKEAMQLVGIATPVAGTAEVHEMKMEGDIMKMRAVDKLDLPAGRSVELRPGGYHLMLQDLKQPLAAGGTVPLTLTFRDAKGAQSKLELNVPVATQGPGTPAGGPTGGHKH